MEAATSHHHPCEGQHRELRGLPQFKVFTQGLVFKAAVLRQVLPNIFDGCCPRLLGTKSQKNRLKLETCIFVITVECSAQQGELHFCWGQGDVWKVIFNSSRIKGSFLIGLIPRVA